MNLPFDIVGGTTKGSATYRAGKKNQDSYHVGWNDQCITAFVSDGCGGAESTEIGSALIVAALTKMVLAKKSPLYSTGSLCYSIDDAVREVTGFIGQLTGSTDPAIATILGFVVTEEAYAVFACGDGSREVNGVWTSPHYPNNSPPFAALGYPTKVVESGTTEHLQSLTIATDGVDYWRKDLDLASGKVSISLEQLIASPEIFSNHVGLQHYLNLLNREYRDAGMVLHGPTLADDTTIVSLRRIDAGPNFQRNELFPGIVLGKRR